jgi:mycothiol system anti-sigma-R factor
MSCGNHHDTPCSEILKVVYLYLDNEDCQIERSLITHHLAECPPCYQEFGLETVLKNLIVRACDQQSASSAIYQRVVAQIADIQVEITRVQKHS